MKQKQNILIIMSDEQRLDTLSCYGNRKPGTPYIDSLAENGIRFTDCNTTYPLCCPARVSLFTGLEPDNHGVLMNWKPMKQEHSHGNFIRQFKDMGYVTTYTGKWHLPGSSPPKFGFDFFNAIPAIIEGKDRGRFIPEYHEYIKEKGYSLDIDLENLTVDDSKLLRIPGKAPCGTSRYKLDDYLEPWLTRRWKAAIENVTEPFFSVCSFVAPHFPMILPKPYDTMFSPEDVVLPENFFTGIEGKPESIYKKHFYLQNKDLPVYEWKRLIAHYWGFCKLIDDQVGEMIDFLKKKGVYDNTVICFTTDHGDMMGSHGLIEKGYPMMYEETNKIPLVIRVPDQKTPVINDEMISITDILPILADFAGQSLNINGTDALTPGKRSFIVSKSCQDEHSAVSIKDKKHKYIFHSNDIDEFYNLSADPMENNNLIDKFEDSDILRHYKEALGI